MYNNNCVLSYNYLLSSIASILHGLLHFLNSLLRRVYLITVYVLLLQTHLEALLYTSYSSNVLWVWRTKFIVSIDESKFMAST